MLKTRGLELARKVTFLNVHLHHSPLWVCKNISWILQHFQWLNMAGTMEFRLGLMNWKINDWLMIFFRSSKELDLTQHDCILSWKFEHRSRKTSADLLDSWFLLLPAWNLSDLLWNFYSVLTIFCKFKRSKKCDF